MMLNEDPQDTTKAAQSSDDTDDDQLPPTSTEARDVLNKAVDSVPDGDEGQEKSRDPEYYGDR